MTRAEHLAWCKQRAIEALKSGVPADAWASMVSDMSKHDETRGHAALNLGTMLLMNGNINSPTAMEKFINDFN